MLTDHSLDITVIGHHSLLVGFSGGLDSTVLLHQLYRLRQNQPFSLRAIYVHHGLSTHADEWLEHCRRLCEAWEIPFISRRVQLCNGKNGVEAEARQRRYQVFREELRQGEALVTAHHQDDQCETLMLALKRGSGPAGLAAMPMAHIREGFYHLRPILDYSRQQLESYARSHQLTWIEDESNQDDRYDRNFLRLNVLPLLAQRWPHFSRMAARSAELCGEQERLLDELLATDLDEAMQADRSLDINALQSASALRRNALIRRWLANCGAPSPSRQALQRIWDEVALSRADATPELFIERGYIRRYQQRLYWTRTFAGQRTTTIAWCDPLQSLVLPDNLGQLQLLPSTIKELSVRAPLDNEPVSIRFYQAGRLHLVGRAGGRSLKKIWQEQGIPPWLRDNIPLLFYSEQLICAVGRFITQEGRTTDNQGYQLVWQGEDRELKHWLSSSSE